MYNRIRITITDTSDRDLLAMFVEAHTRLTDKEKDRTPVVVTR